MCWNMFEEIKLSPFGVENEDPIDESTPATNEDTLEDSSQKRPNGYHDDDTECNHDNDVAGADEETIAERKEPEENGLTETSADESKEDKKNYELSFPTPGSTSPAPPAACLPPVSQAQQLHKLLERHDTAVIYPESVSDADEESSPTDCLNPEEEYTLKCVHCGDSFPRASELQDHMKEKHADKPIRFQCPKCEETFLLKSQLDKHITLHSPTSQNCKICNKTFANVYRLQRHMISHDESTELRKFKCAECGKAFKFKHHLKEHVRIHSGEKPFECPNCGKRFSHSGSYSSHMTSKKCWVMGVKGRRVDRNGNSENMLYYSSPAQPFHDPLKSPPPGSYPQQFLKYDPRNGGIPFFSTPITSSPIHNAGIVAYYTKPLQNIVIPTTISPPQIECSKPHIIPCTRSPVSTTPQISPDVNSNTQLFNMAADKKIDPVSLVKVKMEADVATKGSQADSPKESAKRENFRSDVESNDSGDNICRYCSSNFKSPVQLHQHETYLCKMNKLIVQRISSIEPPHSIDPSRSIEPSRSIDPSRSSPLSTASDTSQHATPNGSIGESGSEEEEDGEDKEHESMQDRKYRMRSLISDQQLQFLRAHYQVNPRPGKSELIKMASEIGFSKRVVQVWFQNMRARDRRKGKNVPYFPNMARFKAADDIPVTTSASAYIPVVPQPFASALTMNNSALSPKLTGQLLSHSLLTPSNATSGQDQPLDLSLKKLPPPAHSNHSSPAPSHTEDQALNLSCRSPSADESTKKFSDDSMKKSSASFQHSAIFKYMQQEGLFHNNLLIPKPTVTMVSTMTTWPTSSTIPAKSSVSPCPSKLSSTSSNVTHLENGKTHLSDEERMAAQYDSDSSDSSENSMESDVNESGRLVIDEHNAHQKNHILMKNSSIFHQNLTTLADVSLAHMEALINPNNKPKRLRKKSWRQVEADEGLLELEDSLTDDDEPLRKKRKSWKNHKLDVEVGMYGCDQCDKMFSKQSSLARHKYEHSGARPFNCDVCSKAFKHKHHLTEHKRLHSGEKPFQCKKCGKRFSHSGSYSQHMNHRYKYCKPNDGDDDD